MLRLFLGILMGLAATNVAAQDPVKIDPKGYKVEIDNEWVRVLRVTQGTHEKAPMHEHPASVVVYLTDLRQRITGADGKVRELTRKARDVAYIDAVKQSEENISDRPLEMIVTELKPGPAKAKSAPITLDLPVRFFSALFQAHVVLGERRNAYESYHPGRTVAKPLSFLHRPLP